MGEGAMKGGKQSKMQTFEVTIDVRSCRTFSVQAVSVEEAVRAAARQYDEDDAWISQFHDGTKCVKSCTTESRLIPESNPEPDMGPYNGQEKPIEPVSNMDRFSENLAALCIRAGCAEPVVMDGIAAFYEEGFDPLLYWRFRPVCSFEMKGSAAVFPKYRHGALFGKSGCLLARSADSSQGAGDGSEGYELWLLEDMTFAATFCCGMAVQDGDGNQASAVYRYPVSLEDDGKGTGLFDRLGITPEGLLKSVGRRIDTARGRY